MNSPKILYSSRFGATSEAELSALAAVYQIVLDSRRKKGACPGAPDDGTKFKEDSADAPIVQD